MDQLLTHPSPAEAHDSAWYRKAFGAGYLDLYAHRDESDAARAVEFLRSTLKLKPGVRLLDLCCGPGRHLGQLVPLLGWGVGLDLSRALLSQARHYCRSMARTSSDGLPHRHGLIEGDMRHLPFHSACWDVVVNLFTSFGYFDSDAENARVIGEIARTLKPSGIFVLDHINRGHLETYLTDASEKILRNGIRVLERRRFDPAAQRIRKRVQWSDASGESVEWTESVRVYSVEELARMFESAGLRLEKQFGDYDGSPLRSDSPRLIAFAVRQSP